MRSLMRSVMRRKPSGVEHADVAGLEPAVLEGGGRLGRLAVVAHHHVAAAHLHLPGIPDADLACPSMGRPTVPKRKAPG